MSRDMNELRERAESGNLTEDDVTYLNQREGIRRFDDIRNLADEPVFEGDDEDESEAADNYEDLTVDELKAELDSRNLKQSGNKDELVARLREDDEDQE